jgi:hypothetical protein
MECLNTMLGCLELIGVEVLLGLVVFVVASLGCMAVVSLLPVRLPATYFSDACPRDFLLDGHPVIRGTGSTLKNLLGVLVVILGLILAMPGVPGPGILTMLIGIMPLDFPGKRRLEWWLISRPKVLETINRRRYGKLPLVLENPGEVKAAADRAVGG